MAVARPGLTLECGAARARRIQRCDTSPLHSNINRAGAGGGAAEVANGSWALGARWVLPIRPQQTIQHRQVGVGAPQSAADCQTTIGLARGRVPLRTQQAARQRAGWCGCPSGRSKRSDNGRLVRVPLRAQRAIRQQAGWRGGRGPSERSGRSDSRRGQ